MTFEDWKAEFTRRDHVTHKPWTLDFLEDVLADPKYRYRVPSDLEDAIDYVLSVIPKEDSQFVMMHLCERWPLRRLGQAYGISTSQASRRYKNICRRISESRLEAYFLYGKRIAEVRQMDRVNEIKLLNQRGMPLVLAVGHVYGNLPTYYLVDSDIYWKLRDRAVYSCDDICKRYYAEGGFRNVRGIGKKLDEKICQQLMDECLRIRSDFDKVEKTDYTLCKD